MSRWLYVNIGVFLVVLGSILLSSRPAAVHILFGLAGLFLILFNWTRHAFFSTIRQTPNRKKKIRLATISKKVMPFHRWTGTLALVLIIFHVWIIISRYGFIGSSFKMWSGLLAVILLFVMVSTGWLRLYWPSGKKRRAHLWTGFCLFFMIVLHTIIF